MSRPPSRGRRIFPRGPPGPESEVEKVPSVSRDRGSSSRCRCYASNRFSVFTFPPTSGTTTRCTTVRLRTRYSRTTSKGRLTARGRVGRGIRELAAPISRSAVVSALVVRSLATSRRDRFVAIADRVGRRARRREVKSPAVPALRRDGKFARARYPVRRKLRENDGTDVHVVLSRARVTLFNNCKPTIFLYSEYMTECKISALRGFALSTIFRLL